MKKNRELIAQAIGVEVADFTYTQQTHTTNVKRVYARERGQSFPETDGMITDVPGICLVTSYADCVPLYFVDPVKKVIGLTDVIQRICWQLWARLSVRIVMKSVKMLLKNSVRIMTKISGLKFFIRKKMENIS